MSELFSKITALVPTLHGWCSVPKAQTLAAAVLALRPEVTVEIGVWGGRSFLPMAMAHKEIGRGVAIGIDPWSPAESVKGQIMKPDADYWSNSSNHEIVKAHFFDLVHKLGVESCIRIIERPSELVEPPAKIDLMHLDGNHSDQAVSDVERFAPRCRVGALMFVDDIHWSGGGVERAVEKLRNMGWQHLYDMDTGAVFQRT